MNFCSTCGSPVHPLVPEGDHKTRFVCESCKTIHYQNPRMIVGCLPRWKDTILLCKRSIEPKNGFWTLPAGFLENDESVEEGALRETMEEANAEVEIVRLFSLYSVPTIGQVYLFFLANLKNLDFRPGAETEQTVLFPVHDIPWDAIAFPSVRFTLERYVENIASEGNEVYRGAYRPS